MSQLPSMFCMMQNSERACIQIKYHWKTQINDNYCLAASLYPLATEGATYWITCLYPQQNWGHARTGHRQPALYRRPFDFWLLAQSSSHLQALVSKPCRRGSRLQPQTAGGTGRHRIKRRGKWFHFLMSEMQCRYSVWLVSRVQLLISLTREKK